jgi:hypothetical protein
MRITQRENPLDKGKLRNRKRNKNYEQEAEEEEEVEEAEAEEEELYLNNILCHESHLSHWPPESITASGVLGVDCASFGVLTAWNPFLKLRICLFSLFLFSSIFRLLFVLVLLISAHLAHLNPRL